MISICMFCSSDEIYNRSFNGSDTLNLFETFDTFYKEQNIRTISICLKLSVVWKICYRQFIILFIAKLRYIIP